MKIALTTDSFVEGQGGVSTAVAALARSLRQRGHRVMVYTAADPSHKQTDLDVVGLRALRYERFPGGRAPMAPISLVQELADFHPAVIHNHSMGSMGLQALAAAHLLGIPILGTCHVFLAGFLKYAPISLDGVPLTEDLAWRYTTAFFNRFPLVATPSAAMQRELVAHGLRAPVTVLSNGVDIDLFSPPPEAKARDPRPLTLLHVGRLGYEKRVDVVLRAFARLVDDFPKARLLVVGDGPEAKALRTLAVDLSVAGQVHFTGALLHNHLPDIYRLADVFITASTIETQGLVVLEAMASGLPIVGVDALALPELIHHEVNGLLVPPEDETAFSQAIARLLSSADLRREMGCASRRLALEHSLPVVAQAYEDLCQQAMLRAQPPLLPRVPRELDPAVAWSSFRAEGRAIKEAGVERFWEVSKALQQWAWLYFQAFAPVVEQVRNGLPERWRLEMPIINCAQEIVMDLTTEMLVHAAPLLARASPLRYAAIWAGEKYIHLARNGDSTNTPLPPGVVADRAEFGEAILHTADRVLASGLSPAVLRRAADNLVRGITIEGGGQSAISRFFEAQGTYPPGFMTLSPGKTCNLRCTGCYASAGPTAEKLDWATFDRIITEAKTLWGVRFLVISGGEPLAYRSEGKGILEAAEKHPDVFFMMYTNGTLITEAVAGRMASLGNLSPAISLEGWRERTDERRGPGVFDKVLAAMDRLRRAGVPFGISLTATRHNAEEILSDEFIHFLFEQQGALYGWIFHYMPIGRSFTLDLMPTPEQRVWMWQRVWQIIRERHIVLADFWNHATLSFGCISGGRTRGGGYLYIDWNGAVSPCVFVPYSPVNVKEVYARGGTLDDVWADPFFAGIRNWQEGYWQGRGNWLAPCIIRDHHADLRRLIAQHEPEPADESARQALLDPQYACGLEEYDERYQTLTEPLWKERYLRDGKR